MEELFCIETFKIHRGEHSDICIMHVQIIHPWEKKVPGGFH
jgi:hypothetical protein